MEYSAKTPFVQRLTYDNGDQVEYQPIELFADGLEPLGINFRVPNHLQPTPKVLSELFFPDRLIQQIATCSNAYARKILPKRQVEILAAEDILRFIGVYYYMGVVVLPAKEDYF